jgi:hypothetical protein
MYIYIYIFFFSFFSGRKRNETELQPQDSSQTPTEGASSVPRDSTITVEENSFRKKGQNFWFVKDLTIMSENGVTALKCVIEITNN